MANVSWVCPTIHPDLAIAPEGTPGHSILFRDAAVTPAADETTLLAATLVAQTAYELFADPALVAAAWREFRGVAPARPVLPSRRAPRWTMASNRRRPQRDGRPPTRPTPRPSPEDPRGRAPTRPGAPAATSRPATAGTASSRRTATSTCRPTSARSSFMKLPWVTDPAELRARGVDVAIVGAPFDDAVSHRPGARFGPRAIREAQYTSGSINSLQLDVEPFEVLTVVDAGDANIVPAWIERGHAMIYRKVLEVAETGRDPDRPRRRPLDHLAERDRGRRGPPAGQHRHRPFRRPRRHRDRRLGRPRRPRHADAPAHRVGRGRRARTSSRSACAATGRRVETFDWMQEQGLRWHFMREIEERGAEAVIADAIDEALDGPDSIYLSLDIDVIDPGMAPGTGTPEPGGMLTRELLRAIRQIVGAVDLAGHGHRRGLAAVRPGRDDRDGRQPRGPRGDQRAGASGAARRPLAACRSASRLEPIARTARATERPDRRRPADGARPPVRPRPRRRPRRPRPVPRARRAGRRADPRARGRHRPARRPAGRGRPPGHRRRPRPGDARPGAPARRDAGRDGDGPARARRGRPGRPAPARRRDVTGSRSSPSTRCWSCASRRRPAGGAPRPWPTTSPRAAWPSSTSGCPTPRTSPGSTAGSSSSGRATDPETGAIVTKAGSAQHDAATGDRHLDHDLRGGRPGRPGPALGPARRAAPRVGRRAARRSPRTPGWIVELLAGDYDLGPLGPGSERAILIAVKELAGRGRGRRRTSGSEARRDRRVVSSGGWHRATRRACSSSRTCRRSRSTSAACSTRRPRSSCSTS